MIYIYVFIVMAALDFVWSRYTKSVVAKRASMAGFYAALIIGLNAAVTLGYINDVYLLIPTAAGAFVGTFLSVRFDK